MNKTIDLGSYFALNQGLYCTVRQPQQLQHIADGPDTALEEHLERLQHSVQKMGLLLPWTIDELTRIVLETLERNQANAHPESNIRIIVTGGSSHDFMTHQGQPRLLVLVSQMPRQPEAWYTDGIKITTMQSRRSLPGAKSIDTRTEKGSR